MDGGGAPDEESDWSSDGSGDGLKTGMLPEPFASMAGGGREGSESERVWTSSTRLRRTGSAGKGERGKRASGRWDARLTVEISPLGAEDLAGGE